MTRSLTPFVLIVMATNMAAAGVVNLGPERGRAVASIDWTDETGRARQLSEFSGYPLILLPIYTRCRGACVQNVDRLKEALTDSANDIRQARVLLFSFDPTDDPARLAKYRRRENIPLGWLTGVTSQTNIDALLESIGFQVGKAGTDFTHPNLVIFFDSKLRIVKWIYGTDYSKADVDLALQVATGRNDWIGQHSDLLYALLLFGSSILCVMLVYCIRQFGQLHGLSRGRQARTSPFVRA
jgi:cytochrome oxidase Cu insertion factor (SCO1/SenC/PrrC family)